MVKSDKFNFFKSQNVVETNANMLLLTSLTIAQGNG